MAKNHLTLHKLHCPAKIIIYPTPMHLAETGGGGLEFRREKWGASSAEMAIGLSESFYGAGQRGRVALTMLNVSSYGL